jgi:hypothetical protein
MSCDFEVAFKILDLEGAELFDFNDHELGFHVESVQRPEESWRKIRVQAPRVDGPGAIVAEAEDGGVFIGRVHVHGSTWVETSQRWELARAAYRASRYCQVQTEVEGVTMTWRAERPNVTPTKPDESAELIRNVQGYVLSFVTFPGYTTSAAPDES